MLRECDMAQTSRWHKPPTHGFTKSGHAVHASTRDFHGARTRLGRLNAKVGLRVTVLVGTMGCAYLFTALALFALPSAMVQGTYFVVVWLSSSFLQLVLLPIIIVGQNLQANASDARAAKTFEDAELMLERLGRVMAAMGIAEPS